MMSSIPAENPMPPSSEETEWVNIASHLPVMAEKQPDSLAVAFPKGGRPSGVNPQREYYRWTYADLESESNILARGLRAVGVERGMHTVLMVKPSPEFFALVFAIFKLGAVMVGVDPGIGIGNLKTCLDEAEPKAFIGIRKAHVARRLLGWAKRTNQINVLVGTKLFPFGTTHSLKKIRDLGSTSEEPVLEQTLPEETAAILFTSGSTGIPKGVVYSHGNFDAQVQALIKLFDIRPGEVDLCTFPLFALYAPAMGMSAIVPEMDFTKPGDVHPPNIIDPIKHFNVTNLFGSPALLKRLSVYAKDQKANGNAIELSSLKRVNSAGAPVPAHVIETIQTMLSPGVQVFTPYGATESLPVACTGSDTILGETAAFTDKGKGVCIGPPVRGLDLRIIDISDEPIESWSDGLELSRGQIGEICVRGPQVTERYFNREQSNQLAKIQCREGFYHRMGDLGYLDEQGRVWFCGRKSHRVVAPNKTYFTVQCEGVFNTHPEIERTALVAVRFDHEIKPAICVELGKQSVKNIEALRDRYQDELLKIGSAFEHTSDIHHFVFYRDSFPVDIRHNSKINREQLAVWAAGQLGGASV